MKSNISIPIKNVPNCNECVNTEDDQGEPNIDICKRQNFINQCVPLLNVKNSGVNILNWDQTGYLWYDRTNNETYTINKNFTISPSDFFVLQYKQKNISFLENYIGDQFDLLTSNRDIISFDIYHLFIDQKPIFELLFKYIINTDANIKNIQSIFSIDSNGKFLGLSFKFNIFNLSLMCNKFFEIIPLFVNDYGEKELIKHLAEIFKDFDLLSLYLLIDYYKSSLTQINNKYNSLMGNADANTDSQEFIEYYDDFFKNSFIKEGNVTNGFYKNANPFVPMANIERGQTMKMTVEKIYKEIAKTIMFMRKMFVELNRIIINYDKVFLMCLLSFRMREKLIAGTWAFDINYCIDFIMENTTGLVHDISKISQMYLKSGPELKEYTRVTYKGVEFSNCMENTMLQFMKLLFYNGDKKKYDMTIIDLLVREQLQAVMTDIFNNIEYENNNVFDAKWVDFLLNLPHEYQKITDSPTFENYSLKMPEYNLEIKSSVKNFMIILKTVFMDKYHDDDLNVFVNNILKAINPSYTSVISTMQHEYGITSAVCKFYIYNNYNMSIKTGHAKFENIEKPIMNMMMAIDQSYNDFRSYFVDKKNTFLIYDDIVGYLFYTYSEITNEKMQKFVEECLKQCDRIKLKNKYTIFSTYVYNMSLGVMKNMINNMEMLKNNNLDDLIFWESLLTINKHDFWNMTFDKNCLVDDWNSLVVKNSGTSNCQQTVWHYLTSINVKHKFWIDAMDKQAYKYWHSFNQSDTSVFDLMFAHGLYWSIFWNDYFKINPSNLYICENWHLNNSKTWENSASVIFIVDFWINVINNDFQTKWPNSMGVYFNLMRNINDSVLWNLIIDKGMCSSWNIYSNDAWYDAVKYIQDENFWIKTIDKQLYLSWDMPNDIDYDGKTVWHELAIYMKNMTFWNKVFDVLTNDDFSDWYNKDNRHDTVWHYFLKQKIDESVLMKIIDKDLCNGWDTDNLWFLATNHITNVNFWKKVIDKKFYESWSNLVTPNGDTIWHLLVYRISDISFWNEVFDVVPTNIIDNVFNVPNKDRATPWILFLTFPNCDEELMLKILEKGLCDNWCSNGLFIRMVRSEQCNYIRYWDEVLSKKLYDKCSIIRWTELLNNINSKCWDKFIKNGLYRELSDDFFKIFIKYYDVNEEEINNLYPEYCTYVKQRLNMEKNELTGGGKNYYEKYIKYKNKYTSLKEKFQL